LPELCASVQCVAPSNLYVQAALSNAGFRYSQFHHDPTAIKTDAPPLFIFDMMRAWCREHPPEGSKHKKQSQAAVAILAKETTHTVSFRVSEEVKADHERRKKLAFARFPPNPEDFWGPKRRAGAGGAGGGAAGGGGGGGGGGGVPQPKRSKRSSSSS